MSVHPGLSDQLELVLLLSATWRRHLKAAHAGHSQLQQREPSLSDGRERERVRLQAGLHRLGLPCSPTYLQTMLSQYDEDHDGTPPLGCAQHAVHLWHCWSPSKPALPGPADHALPV